jgi:hypothetical protein
MTRHILAVDNTARVCLACVTALGGRLNKNFSSAASVFFAQCAHCGREGVCAIVADFVWAATSAAPEAPPAAGLSAPTQPTSKTREAADAPTSSTLDVPQRLAGGRRFGESR